MTVTAGCSASIASTLPSVEPLSTTIASWLGQSSRSSDFKHPSVSSRPFQFRTTVTTRRAASPAIARGKVLRSGDSCRGSPVDLSVVIPTRDRWDVLQTTLDALRAQAASGLTCEYVVVNNGSGPAPALEKSAQWVSVIDEPQPGAAAARNAGIATASSDLVLFLGDDCRPARPGFLSGHVAAHRAAGDPWLAVVGGIEPDPGLAGTPFMRWLARSGKLIDETAFTGDWRSFYTGNVSLSREALLAVGGFDERFSGYGWEDADLALRLADHGLRLERRRDLLVHHAHEYDLQSSLARMEAVGRGANLLERLHDHRRPLPGPAKSRARLAAARAAAPVVDRVPG